MNLFLILTIMMGSYIQEMTHRISILMCSCVLSLRFHFKLTKYRSHLIQAINPLQNKLYESASGLIIHIYMASVLDEMVQPF